MIHSPAARTRALYMWETQDLYCRRGVRDMRTIDVMQVTCASMWCHIGGALDRRPKLIFEPQGDVPYCLGSTLIALCPCNRTNLVLLHELTHAQMRGTPANPHNVSFVKSYLHNMAAWFRWEYGELLMLAKLRRLL